MLIITVSKNATKAKAKGLLSFKTHNTLRLKMLEKDRDKIQNTIH